MFLLFSPLAMCSKEKESLATSEPCINLPNLSKLDTSAEYDGDGALGQHVTTSRGYPETGIHVAC